MSIDLAYDDTGKGSETFVLIHGAFGRRVDYSEQVAYFSPSFRVIAMDLRGHGDSPKPDDGYSISQFADDVAALCRSLDVTDAFVVGHSMGGVIAVELASRYPELVKAVATLDSPSIIPGWHDRHTGPYGAGIHGPDYLRILKGFLDVASSATDDQERRAASMKAIDAMPRHAIVGTWDAIGDWDPEQALKRVSVPLLYLDHGQPDLDYELLRSFVPQLLTGQTVGAGHKALMEVPDQVNAMLSRFFSNAETLASEARKGEGSFRYDASK
jgi:pimeloyl-ACP methyl ester carboxylesterase